MPLNAIVTFVGVSLLCAGNAPFQETSTEWPSGHQVRAEQTFTDLQEVANLQEVKILGDPVDEEHFGYGVALDGDTLVVGGPRFYLDFGVAYVFERHQGGANNWGGKQLIVIDPDPTPDADPNFPFYAQFGRDMSIHGDTVAIAAVQDADADGNGFGSVYLFERNTGGPGNWGQVKRVTLFEPPEPPIFFTSFGISVSLSGDVLAVGEWSDDDFGQNSGAVYLFERNAGGADNWGQVKKLTASDGAAGDWFGGRVSRHGDVLVVAAAGDDDGGHSSGAAYVFERNAGGVDNWGEVKKLTASDAVAGDQFGQFSVAAHGDVIVVGATYKDGGAGETSGAAYVFERDAGGAGNWGEVKKLTASDAAAGDRFGVSVAVNGDVIVVGAHVGNVVAGGEDLGSVYVFQRNAGGEGNWGEVTELNASDATVYTAFGWSVAVSGNTIVAGAPYDNEGAPESGSAYVFIDHSVLLFEDGFESGDTAFWSFVAP